MFTPEPDMGLDDMGTRVNGSDMSLGDMSAPDQLDVMLEQLHTGCARFVYATVEVSVMVFGLRFSILVMPT